MHKLLTRVLFLTAIAIAPPGLAGPFSHAHPLLAQKHRDEPPYRYEKEDGDRILKVQPVKTPSGTVYRIKVLGKDGRVRWLTVKNPPTP